MKKKKVLLLGNHGFVIYNFRKELIQKLLAEGYEVYISLPNDEKVEIMVGWGCKFVETKIDRRGTNPVSDSKLILHYLRILKEIKPDVVLTYTIKPNLYGGLACRLLKIPCVNNITGLGSGFNQNSALKKFLSILYKVSLKKSYCVFFQNTEDRNTLLESKTITSNHELIPGSGVNLDDFKLKPFPLKEQAVSFIFIGRIMKDKGIDQYLEASKIIKEKYPETIFNVIGFIETTHPHYNEMIGEYNKKGYIRYLGYQSDVKPFIEQSHCIIQASHGGEGLSNVLLETAATGRVLIASNIPGCRETIDVGSNGFTFEARNTADLVDKIESFIQMSYEDMEKMGINARLKVEKEFDRAIVIKAYMDKIERICNYQ
ncbi:MULTISPECIES: glycosyltransferase family 4 protein [unclassified Paenibacillus]|uniref:glycosyltransferase family 4 protein n=1 Tax=unclassified Paenibacillus TaxID=185978 RepID=UPI0024068FEF|nr:MULTISPECIES: glycosyltransferase family 4 protein [unclassified Paenibacillus]MDF9844051.1 glycosyltransferase involved in cell wall biosynthesis [Paenibacillus sp. PastF-2]MDF9850656.1 glycosyltransferase involved in cell wall biosynthesis [Paenibacillus sp. PastM-2]MDF9857193.1 glycosyltransferase involved in cell wall biosynthesis [Paenibacillus sp. PastF-1]MDH6482506.1 glycosyltransferase involved in cell wall biosynthesis [Paenibacillus sp. PastH-2]MDH6509891.1 glycosyltransferase inv